MLSFNVNTTQNLLAFSGGIDSTALFFLLMEKNIPFDIAIVDYNIRSQSKEEVAYAKSLAKKYHKKCFVKEVDLENESNFEQQAREIRYGFFEQLIKEHSYEALLTAHQLDDCLEWFFMQFSKGAGLYELLGLKAYEKRNNYLLLRPLLHITKEELIVYLKQHNIHYFIDKSNEDTKYTRNYFRQQFTASFLKEFKTGILNSLQFLQKDLDSLDINFSPLFHEKEFVIFEISSDNNLNLRVVDKDLKQRGHVLSQKEREEIVKQKQIVISHNISVALTSKYIFIAPYTKKVMPKVFKEVCRELKIPKNIRSYLYQEHISLKDLKRIF
jgi:tRNA(Ile)-lysidine synthase